MLRHYGDVLHGSESCLPLDHPLASLSFDPFPSPELFLAPVPNFPVPIPVPIPVPARQCCFFGLSAHLSGVALASFRFLVSLAFFNAPPILPISTFAPSYRLDVIPVFERGIVLAQARIIISFAGFFASLGCFIATSIYVRLQFIR